MFKKKSKHIRVQIRVCNGQKVCHVNLFSWSKVQRTVSGIYFVSFPLLGTKWCTLIVGGLTCPNTFHQHPPRRVARCYLDKRIHDLTFLRNKRANDQKNKRRKKKKETDDTLYLTIRSIHYETQNPLTKGVNRSRSLLIIADNVAIES